MKQDRPSLQKKNSLMLLKGNVGYLLIENEKLTKF